MVYWLIARYNYCLHRKRLHLDAGQRASTRDRGPAAKKLEFSVKQFHDAAKEGDKDRVSLLLELKGANVKVRQVNYICHVNSRPWWIRTPRHVPGDDEAPPVPSLEVAPHFNNNES